jgi:hypothetical protein
MRKTVVVVGVLASCGMLVQNMSSQLKPTHRLKPSPSSVATAFATGGPYAKDSMYACLLDAYHQGISLQQALVICQANMLEDADKGWGNDPWAAVGMPKPNPSTYDPRKVTMACNTGDPRKGAGKGGGEPLQEGCIGKCQWVTPNQFEGERFTYGGKGQEGGFGTNEHGGVGVIVYKGLTEEQATKEKQQALDAEARATKEYQDLVAKQTKELQAQGKKAEDWEKDPAMKAAREAAAKKVDDTSKKANEDPNAEVKGGISRPSAEGSACEMALRGAREFLRECNRSGWKSNECQTLLAKMKGCPEPAYIYVDPDSGYACGVKADMETLLEAWRQQCEKLKRPNPGGPNPCDPPRVEGNGRMLVERENGGTDICKSLVAHIDPESPECAGTVTVQRFGEPNISELLVFGLNKLGGPTFVIPVGPGDTPPFPGPKPDPKPN